jgi:coenzyme F420 hydrogenase subunit beta
LQRNHKDAVEKSQAWLKENTKRYAFKKLEREIIKTGACVECGSCVAGCPVDALSGELIEGKYVPTLTGKCTACGICYAMCPRTAILDADIIGNYLSVWQVRSLRDHHRQDGGAVTAILAALMDKGTIEATVMVNHSEEHHWLPMAKRATTSEEILSSGGTMYSHAQVIGEMHDCLKDNLSSIAVVGTACNIEAIGRMQKHPASIFNIDPTPPSVFKVSLFCTESFNYNGLVAFLYQEGISIDSVGRFEISKGEFRVTYDEETKTWPVKDLDHIVNSSCAYCTDFTGMVSDLSCGNIGSEEGWTTVIARSKAGTDAINLAIQEGYIEGEKLDTLPIAVINSARFKMNKRFKLQSVH